MRLTDFEVNVIKTIFLEVFNDGDIYLFGSRVDDNKKGGDIDLYLVPSKKFDDEIDRKLEFLMKLKEKIGEQKIDIVMAKDKDRPIEKEALINGVTLDVTVLKINKYLNECDKHRQRIEKAYQDIKYILPLSLKTYQNLSDDDVKTIDQYLFRFSKLQDTIGEKLFKLIIDEFVENSFKLSFIDILNRLEKIGIISSVNDWKSLRSVRNNISHQYDDDSEEMADAINKMFAQKDVLLEIYGNIQQYYQNKRLKKIL